MNDYAHTDIRPNRSLAFPKSCRVRKQADFDRVNRQKAFAADDILVLRGSPNGREHARLGLSVSRKVGNAVVRNRWKRLIREAFRLSRENIPQGMDFVVRPRRGAVAELAAIQASLPRLCWRLAKLAKKASS